MTLSESYVAREPVGEDAMLGAIPYGFVGVDRNDGIPATVVWLWKDGICVGGSVGGGGTPK